MLKRSLPFQKRNCRFAICALLLCALFMGHVLDRGGSAATPPRAPRILDTAHATPAPSYVAGDTAYGELSGLDLITADPLAFLRRSRENYYDSVRDYTCRLTKRELLGSKLSDEQVADVKFREGPLSVFMHMIQNPGKARRILYVKNMFSDEGREQAVIEPEGAIARLLVRSVRRPIDGPDARRASRRLVSEFGFASSLDLIIKFAELSLEANKLDLRFIGVGEFSGRPTFIIERRLPIDDTGRWPDSLLVVHMDQEWQLPVACYSYGDREKQDLLGKYEYTDVQFNVGLGDKDFQPETYGL